MCMPFMCMSLSIELCLIVNLCCNTRTVTVKCGYGLDIYGVKVCVFRKVFQASIMLSSFLLNVLTFSIRECFAID